MNQTLPTPAAPASHVVKTSADFYAAVAAARAGDVIAFTAGNYLIERTLTLKPANVTIDFGGASVGFIPSPGCSSNLVLAGDGQSVRNGRITQGTVLFRLAAANQSVVNIRSDDYVSVATPAGFWKGVACNFAITSDTAQDATISGCAIGITGSVSVYMTCDHTMTDCRLAGSLGEYDYRVECLSTGVKKVKKAVVTGCSFGYANLFNKLSVVGVRLGDGVALGHCVFAANIRFGETAPAGMAAITSPTQCNAGCSLVGCSFVGDYKKLAIPPVAIHSGVTLIASKNRAWTDGPMYGVDAASILYSDGDVLVTATEAVEYLVSIHSEGESHVVADAIDATAPARPAC